MAPTAQDHINIGMQLVHDGDTNAALEQFNALWEGQRCDTCRRREICPVPLEEPRL